MKTLFESEGSQNPFRKWEITQYTRRKLRRTHLRKNVIKASFLKPEKFT